MSTLYGTSVVKNGLVLYYDMSNTQKSWQGAPATNEIVNIVYGFDYSGTTITPVTNNSLTYNGFTTHSMVNTTSSFNCYISGGNLNAASLSTVWTFSAYIRRADNLPISSLTVYIYATINGVYTGNIVDAGNGWYLIYYTASGTNVAAGLVGFTGLLQNVTYYVSAPMLSKTTVPVPPLAVQQTRSTTQAILDLTKINTLTANSLTYASDNTFSFNYDTPNYITVPLATAFNKTAGTMNFWVYPTRYNGGNGYFVNREDATANAVDWFWIGPYSDTFYFRIGNGSDCCSNDLSFGSVSTVIPTNTWINLCFTWQINGTSVIYKNGVVLTSRSIGNIPNTNPASNGRIGLGHANGPSYFDGKLPTIQIYNRPLTAEEVLCNFQAIRARYGI